jgi:hypothetical protein
MLEARRYGVAREDRVGLVDVHHVVEGRVSPRRQRSGHEALLACGSAKNNRTTVSGTANPGTT